MSVALAGLPDDDLALLADLVGGEEPGTLPADEWQAAVLMILAGCRPLVEQYERTHESGTVSGVSYVDDDRYVVELVINKMPWEARAARMRGEAVQFMRYQDVMEFLSTRPRVGRQLQQWLEDKWDAEEEREALAAEGTED